MNLSFGQGIETKKIIHGHDHFELMIDVFNKDTRQPLSNVLLYLYELHSYKLIKTAYTTTKGSTSFFIDPMKEYAVETCKQLYLKGGINLFNCYDTEDNLFCVNGASEFDFMSAGGADKPRAFLSASVGLDSITVGKTFQLENVYYDLDKWRLRSSSKKELNKLYSILSQFPSLTVELSSHTDSRGSDNYNEKLSSNRANSCYEYLISKGIDENRIIPKGYGESKLVNDCGDDEKCRESQHQKNRRTEFTIVSFDGEECDTSGI